MVNHKLIRISNDVNDMLEDARKEFIKHHPDWENIKISYDKIIYETAKFYLKG